MLKQRPKQFWGMLKSKATRDLDLPIAKLVEFNKAIFHDANITPDEFAPLTTPTQHHIT
jgi:hypothetical protein